MLARCSTGEMVELIVDDESNFLDRDKRLFCRTDERVSKLA